jgi:hypothetical protein
VICTAVDDFGCTVCTYHSDTSSGGFICSLQGVVNTPGTGILYHVFPATSAKIPVGVVHSHFHYVIADKSLKGQSPHCDTVPVAGLFCAVYQNIVFIQCVLFPFVQLGWLGVARPVAMTIDEQL